MIYYLQAVILSFKYSTYCTPISSLLQHYSFIFDLLPQFCNELSFFQIMKHSSLAAFLKSKNVNHFAKWATKRIKSFVCLVEHTLTTIIKIIKLYLKI